MGPVSREYCHEECIAKSGDGKTVCAIRHCFDRGGVALDAHASVNGVEPTQAEWRQVIEEDCQGEDREQRLALLG